MFSTASMNVIRVHVQRRSWVITRDSACRSAICYFRPSFFFLLVDGVHRKLYKRDRHQKAFAASPLVVPTHSLLFNALSHLPSNTIYPEQESKPGIGLNEDGPLLLLELLHVPSTTCHSSVTVLNYEKYFLVTLHLYYTDWDYHHEKFNKRERESNLRLVNLIFA